MAKLINGDMLHQENAIQDNSIDLLLTDPPYNISNDGAVPVWIDKDTGKNKTTIHNQRFSENFDENWDDVEHTEFLKQMKLWSNFWFKKVRKGGAFVIFISDRYLSFLWNIMEESGFEPKRVWTWKKPAAVPFNRKVNPVSGCEYILFGIKPGGKRIFNSDIKANTIVERYAAADKASSILYKLMKDNKGILDLDEIFKLAKIETKKVLDSRIINEDGTVQIVVPNTITFSGGLGKNKIHPTQKPVEILEYFIELLTNSGDLILDTFAGSGSVGEACYNTRRECILIERDDQMFQRMKQRIDGTSFGNEFFDF